MSSVLKFPAKVNLKSLDLIKNKVKRNVFID